jgi:adenosylhomocysteine nucleosidase
LIAIICASWSEIERNKKCIEITDQGEFDELQFLRGQLAGKLVILGRTGIGIKRARKATSYLIQKFKPDMIISAGHGGAICEGLKIGDIVVGEWVMSLRRGEKRRLYNKIPGQVTDFIKGGILSENRFIYDPLEKKQLFQDSGAICVDMETWGVVEGADQSGTPIISVRSMSDDNRDRLPEMGYIYNSVGKLNRRTALKHFISNKSQVYSYIKLLFFDLKKSSSSLSHFLERLILGI